MPSSSTKLLLTFISSFWDSPVLPNKTLSTRECPFPSPSHRVSLPSSHTTSTFKSKLHSRCIASPLLTSSSLLTSKFKSMQSLLFKRSSLLTSKFKSSSRLSLAFKSSPSLTQLTFPDILLFKLSSKPISSIRVSLTPFSSLVPLALPSRFPPFPTIPSNFLSNTPLSKSKP
ncbi:hypothetical protein V8G54_023217, partial [Vigna mungo]